MMKKTTLRLSVFVLAALLLFSALFAVSAAASPVIDDNADVFTAEQEADLTVKMETACNQTGWQLIIYSFDQGLSGDKLRKFCDNYYDRGGFAKDAIMFAIDNESGKRKILAYGDVEHYFDKTNRLDDMADKLLPYTQSGDMYGAAQVFITETEAVHSMGKPNLFVLSLQRRGWIYGLIAAAAGLLFFFGNRSRYKNMGKAGTYDLNANSSVDVAEYADDFVTQHTTVRTIERNNSSSGGHTSGGHASKDF